MKKAILPALFLGLCFGGAAHSQSMTQAPGVQAVSASQVLSTIHSVNQMEILMGQMARQKGATGSIRRYGVLLTRDHRAADRRIMALARSENIGVAAARMSPHDMQVMRVLSAAQGRAFDRLFLAAMNQGHIQAIHMLNGAQGQVADGGVRRIIAELVPILGQHQTLSQHLQGKA